MKKIAVVTATRAEYGLLYQLIKKINEDKELVLDLIVTGAHLSEKQGHTIDEIIKDGFAISHKISILEDDNTAYGISLTMANAIHGFARCFRDDRPDMVVILGDRTEMLGVASAAMNECIPIAHIHGGEITEGAVDDCIRHAITKMSFLHFTCTEVYRRRVIQMGEAPERVFNVGALSVDNIKNEKLMNENELRDSLSIPHDMFYVVMTYHPETLDSISVKDQVEELLSAIECYSDLFFVVTSANADIGGTYINDRFQRYCSEHDNACFFYSLGMVRYLSAVKYAAFVLGNSSSGVMEVPAIGTPSVNIGDRQRGRIIPDTVVCCECKADEIKASIEKTLKMEHKPSDVFGVGNTSEKIIDVIKRILFLGVIDLKKGFYELDGQGWYV